MNSSSTPTTLYQLASLAEQEAEKDPRVTSCTCEVDYNLDTLGFELTATVVTGAGPFELVANVNQVGVQLNSVTAS